MANKLTTVFEWQVKDALKRIAELNKGLDSTESALEDVESAGKVAARALSAAAEAIETDLRDTKEAADALAQALGPDLASKVDTTSIVGDLKAMGLTTDDVKADAEELAAALKKLKDVGEQAGPGVKQAFDDIDRASAQVGRTTDNTRSVVANFAGNAVQELPGVSAAMGPLNMAIGQFAEYATEGNIGFKNFLKAGLGLGGLSVALAGVAFVMDKFGDNAEQAKKRQEGLNKAVEAFRQGKTQDAAQEIVDAYGDIIAKANEVGFTTSEVVQAIVGDYDIQAAAARKMSTEELRALDGTLLGYTEYGTKVGEVADTIRGASEDWKSQNGTLDENAEVLADVTRELGKNEDQQKGVTRALGASEAAQQAYNDELDRNIGLMDDILPDLYDYEESTYELAESVRELREQQRETNEILADGTLSAEEHAAALEAERLATIGAARVAFDSAEDYAAQQGAVEGSKQQIDLMVDELERQKLKYPELAGEIDKYIAKLRQIPATVTTTASFVPGGDQKYFGKGGSGSARATGGNVSAGRLYRVNEQGDEMFVPNVNGTILSAGRTQQMLQGGAAAGSPPNVTINVTAGVGNPVEIGRQVRDVLAAYLRNGGEPL